MNQEQFKQSWYQLEGHLKKRWLKLTHEDLARIDGDLHTFNSAIEQRYGNTKADVSKWADRWYARWIGWYEGYEEETPPADVHGGSTAKAC
jgi:uncharacterized protein YjbJ (UPF0337 family)